MRRGLIHLGRRRQMLVVTFGGFLGRQLGVKGAGICRAGLMIILVNFLLVGDED